MKMTQTEMIAISALIAAGVYFLFKQRETSQAFQQAYNALAGQVASGNLVYKTPTANTL